ncbi:hypothetical protein Hte_004135 [Hypoxylon texense]
MKGVYAAVGVLSMLAYQSHANKDFITLTTKGDAWITEAVATLVLGDVPNPMGGDVALWSAIMMDKRDFLQGVTENAVPSPYCTNLGSNWCNFAYTLALDLPRMEHQSALPRAPESRPTVLKN